MVDKTIVVSRAWAHVVEKKVGRSEAIKSGRFQVLGELMESGPNTELIGPVLDRTQPMCKRASLGGRKKPMNPKPVDPKPMDPKPSKQVIGGSQPNMYCNKAFLGGPHKKIGPLLGETLEREKAQALNAF